VSTAEPLTVAGPRRIHTGFLLHGPFTHFDCAITLAHSMRGWQVCGALAFANVTIDTALT